MRVIKIGEFNVTAIECGRFYLDGGAMFGIVPRGLWEKSDPPDNLNRIEMSTRAIFISGNDRNILVDNGIGGYMNDKFKKIYGFNGSELSKTLSELNLDAGDITDLIITHLHFDHAGGTVVKDTNKFKLAFPNARIHIQESHLAWAIKSNRREKGSFLPEYMEVIKNSKNLSLHRGQTEILPGIEVSPTFGHTVGHQIVKINSGENSLIYCADLVPLASHLRIPFVMAYDLFPLVTMQEKEELFAQAAKFDSILVFEHDPRISAAKIRKGDKDFEISKRIEI